MYYFPLLPTMHKHPNFPHPHQQLLSSVFCLFVHLTVVILVVWRSTSWFLFALISLMISDAEYLFMCFLAICCVFSEEMSIQVLCSFYLVNYLAAMDLNWGVRALCCGVGVSLVVVYGILVPQPGIKPTSPALEGRFLIPGPPEVPLCPF